MTAMMQEHSINILLAEDNDDDIFITRKAFEKSSIKNNLHVVRDGQEVLDYIYGNGPYLNRTQYPLPQLLLLDINMPKKNGIDVLKILRADSRNCSLRVIMLTSSRAETDIARSYENGACAYVNKSLSFDDFKIVIEKLNLFWSIVIFPKN